MQIYLCCWLPLLAWPASGDHVPIKLLLVVVVVIRHSIRTHVHYWNRMVFVGFGLGRVAVWPFVVIVIVYCREFSWVGFAEWRISMQQNPMSFFISWWWSDLTRHFFFSLFVIVVASCSFHRRNNGENNISSSDFTWLWHSFFPLRCMFLSYNNNKQFEFS